MAGDHPPTESAFVVKVTAPNGQVTDVTPVISELAVRDSVTEQASTASLVITDWAAYGVCPTCGQRHLPLLVTTTPSHGLTVSRPSSALDRNMVFQPNDTPRYGAGGSLVIERTVENYIRWSAIDWNYQWTTAGTGVCGWAGHTTRDDAVMGKVIMITDAGCLGTRPTFTKNGLMAGQSYSYSLWLRATDDDAMNSVVLPLTVYENDTEESTVVYYHEYTVPVSQSWRRIVLPFVLPINLDKYTMCFSELPSGLELAYLQVENSDYATSWTDSQRIGEVVTSPEVPTVATWTYRLRYVANAREHVILDGWPKFRLGSNATGQLYLQTREADASEPVTNSVRIVPLGTENHVALTTDGQAVRAYINGTLYLTVNTTLPSEAAYLAIGGSGDRNHQIDGTVRTVLFDWQRAWSAADVFSDYAGQSPSAGAEEWLTGFDNLGGTFYAEALLPSALRCGHVLEIWNGSDKLFLGTFSKITREQESGLAQWAIDADDYTAWLASRIVSEDYRSDGPTEGLPHLIIQALLIKYAPEIGRALTTDTPAGYIQPSTVVFERMVFARKPLLDCIKELASAIDFDFYVDEDKRFRFFDRWTNYSAYTLAEDDAEAGVVTCEQLEVDEDISGLVNRVWVYGGTQLSDNYTETFTGDGVKRVWVLGHVPYDWTVTVDGVTKTGGIVGTNDPSDVDYLIDLDRKELQFGVAPASNADIDITYRYEMPVAVVSEDGNSIATYGVFEEVVTDDALTSRTAAIDRANVELTKRATPTRKVSVAKFHESGIRSGQILPVSFALLSDTAVNLLVQEVSHNYDESSGYSVDLTLGDMPTELTGVLADMERRVLSLELTRIAEQIGSDILDTLTSITATMTTAAILSTPAPTVASGAVTMAESHTNTLNSTGFLTDEAMVDVCDVVP